MADEIKFSEDELKSLQGLQNSYQEKQLQQTHQTQRDQLNLYLVKKFYLLSCFIFILLSILM